ncbi:hypothetical protein EYR36_002205 [Pleurotus pulmonarius]|nr:hypothetical protein EYR36_002205 [Pleurotus pulmonarius]
MSPPLRLFSLTRPIARSFTTRSVTQTPSRSRRLARRAAYTVLGLGGIWALDRQFNASAIARSFRTLWTCAAITVDYKLNFTKEKSDQIHLLHERVADRMYNLLTSNGGLYIKFGQAIGANAALLPEPMQAKFAKLFDDAPQVPYSTVLSVFQSEFGRPPSGPGGVFEIFEEQSVAAASIAQVHRAKLWPSEGHTEEKWVAVKIQKPDVGRQMEWDLGAYRVAMWFFENVAFDLPVYFVVDFINEHLRRELDFVQEAASSQETARFVASEPRLSQSVYIPKVYPEFSTKRIMTAEWIDGVRLSNRQAVRQLMGEEPSLAVDAPPPLKGGTKAVMQTMVELFSAQIFSWGWVHCDPHPGNIIIRPHPSGSNKPQLVLLDHGLYVRLSEEFRRQYADLWRALLAGDFATLKDVTEQWGIGAPDIFASATLLKPVKLGGGKEKQKQIDELAKLSEYDQSVLMKERLRGFLVDTDKMPKPLVFLGRNMRSIQGYMIDLKEYTRAGNNQAFGSPVNRIRITGYWASRSLTTVDHYASLRDRLQESWFHFVFRSTMFLLDGMFYWQMAVQRVRRVFGLKTENFEDELERMMQGVAKSNFGIEVSGSMFEG